MENSKTMTIKEMVEIAEIVNMVHHPIVEGTVFKLLDKDMIELGVKEKLKQPNSCANALLEYKNKIEKYNITEDVTNYDLVDVYMLINIGIIVYGEYLYSENKPEIPEEDLEKIKTCVSTEVNFDRLRKALNFIKENGKRINSILESIRDTGNVKDEDMEFMKTEILYQLSVGIDHPFFTNIKADDENVVEKFVENYINVLQPNVTLHEKGDDTDEENDGDNK